MNRPVRVRRLNDVEGRQLQQIVRRHHRALTPPAVASSHGQAFGHHTMSDSHLTNQILDCGPIEHSLQGWSITHANQSDWVAWGGSTGKARAKVLGIADDYYLALIEAEPGYRGDPHKHNYPEFVYVLDGSLRTQGVEMVNGDAYAAAAGSVHTDFATHEGATYVLIFKL